MKWCTEAMMQMWLYRHDQGVIDDETERQTDTRPTHYTQCYRRGQHKNVSTSIRHPSS